MMRRPDCASLGSFHLLLFVRIIAGRIAPMMTAVAVDIGVRGDTDVPSTPL